MLKIETRDNKNYYLEKEYYNQSGLIKGLIDICDVKDLDF